MATSFARSGLLLPSGHVYYAVANPRHERLGGVAAQNSAQRSIEISDNSSFGLSLLCRRCCRCRLVFPADGEKEEGLLVRRVFVIGEGVEQQRRLGGNQVHVENDDDPLGVGIQMMPNGRIDEGFRTPGIPASDLWTKNIASKDEMFIITLLLFNRMSLYSPISYHRPEFPPKSEDSMGRKSW